MINPGGNFEALREARGNIATARVAIDLNNNALASAGATVAASTQYSADWPPAGVIDGDRTHINAGAPGAAYNGVGGSVWRGSVVSDGGGNLSPSEYILIDFGRPIQVNRIKLIFWPSATKNNNLGAIAPADYLIEMSAVAGGGFGDGGFGDGGFGDGSGDFASWTGLVDKSSEIGKAATTISSGQVTGNTNDINVFEDPTLQTVQRVRVTFTKLQAASQNVRVVAIEIVRAVDVSTDVCGITRARRKDYMLNHRTATQVDLVMINFLKKYSPRHTPTAAEAAAGSVSNQLRPGLECRVFAGFSGLNAQMSTCYLTKLNPDGKTRLCKIMALDYLKYFIQRPVTTPLQAGKSIEYLVELLANIKNFPSNMMSLDTTTLTVAYYMPADKMVFDEMQTLGDATGDSDIFIDEFGTLNFRSYLNVISHIWLVNDSADFQAGTNTNTDSTTTPGEVQLAKVTGNYVPQGTWISTLSPSFAGKIQWSSFEVNQVVGASTSIDWYLRVTNDAGATFTPWRPVYPLNGGIMSKWNHAFAQIQVKAVLRSSDVTQTPSFNSFTVHYKSRGGSAKFTNSPVFSVLYNKTMTGASQIITDQVGGNNYLITKATVQSNPTFLASASQTAWIGTNNSATIGISNPLNLPAGITTIQADFGSTKYETPQTVNITYGTAVGTATISNHPSKPILTINLSVGGSITALSISGTPFINSGAVNAVALAPQAIIDEFGENEDTFQNDYIDNIDLATDIANGRIAKFSAPIDWLQEVPMRFSPNLQINDRGTVVEPNLDIDDDYFVVGATDTLNGTAGETLTAETKLELIKVGVNGAIGVPAFFGSGGLYYYDSFRFGSSNAPLRS